jgi:hypothetical protein
MAWGFRGAGTSQRTRGPYLHERKWGLDKGWVGFRVSNSLLKLVCEIPGPGRRVKTTDEENASHE